MDSVIRGRFYQVENFQNGQATLFDALNQLWDHPQREIYEEIFGGIRVRMERFESDVAVVGRGFVAGEFVRQQTENVPPIALQGEPLEGHNNPLGHRSAFRYHAQSGILLLESRPSGLTPIRVDGLIKARLAPHSGYYLSPVVTEDALYRLRNGTPRRVQFRVARPADMQVIEGDRNSLGENLARLANNFDGLTVEASVGFPQGNRAGQLNLAAINSAVRWATGNRDHVEKFKVKISEEEEPIDIFAEQLKVTENLRLDNLDVDENYRARRDLFSRAFNDYMPLIQRTYME
jgi:hypothetical protein